MCRWLAKRAAASPPIFVGGAKEWIDRPRTQEEENFRAFMGACGDGNDELAMDLASLPWNYPAWYPGYDQDPLPLGETSQMVKRWARTTEHRQLAFEVGTRLRETGRFVHALIGSGVRIRCIRSWETEGGLDHARDSAPTRESLRKILVREADESIFPRCEYDTSWNHRSNDNPSYDAGVDAYQFIFGGRDNLLDRSVVRRGIESWRDCAPEFASIQMLESAVLSAMWAPLESYQMLPPVSGSFFFALRKFHFRRVPNALGDLYLANMWMHSRSLLEVFNQERRILSLPEL